MTKHEHHWLRAYHIIEEFHSFGLAWDDVEERLLRVARLGYPTASELYETISFEANFLFWRDLDYWLVMFYGRPLFEEVTTGVSPPDREEILTKSALERPALGDLIVHKP